MAKLDIVEVLRRANNGPLCSVKNWDSKVIPQNAARKVKEHNLTKTCDTNNPVNTDDALADEFFKAGFELATEIGTLCPDTERVIEVSKEELNERLRETPSQMILGRGKE